MIHHLCVASEPETTCVSFEVVVLGQVGSWAFLGFTGTTFRFPLDLRITPECREWDVGWHGRSGRGAGPVRSAECTCTARSPLLVLFLIPGVRAETTGDSMSPAATGGQMESWPLAPPCRPRLGADQRQRLEGKNREVSRMWRKTSPVSVVSILKGQLGHSVMGWSSWIPGVWRPAVPKFQNAVGHSPGGLLQTISVSDSEGLA